MRKCVQTLDWYCIGRPSAHKRYVVSIVMAIPAHSSVSVWQPQSERLLHRHRKLSNADTCLCIVSLNKWTPAPRPALTWNTKTMPATMEYMSYLPSCLLRAELMEARASRYCFRTFLPMLVSTSEVLPSRKSFIQLPWALSAMRNCSKPASATGGRSGWYKQLACLQSVALL